MLAIEPLVKVPRWGMVLGAASYAVYLVHTPVNAVVQHLARHLPPSWLGWGAGHAVLVASGLAVGIAVHRLFERPVTRWLRTALAARIGRSAAAANDAGALAMAAPGRQGEA